MSKSKEAEHHAAKAYPLIGGEHIASKKKKKKGNTPSRKEGKRKRRNVHGGSIRYAQRPRAALDAPAGSEAHARTGKDQIR